MWVTYIITNEQNGFNYFDDNANKLQWVLIV